MKPPDPEALSLDSLFVELAIPSTEAERLGLALLEQARPQAREEHWSALRPFAHPSDSPRCAVELTPPEGLYIDAHDAWQLAHAMIVAGSGVSVEPTFRDRDRFPEEPPASQPLDEHAEGVLSADASAPDDVGWHHEVVKLSEAHAWLRERDLGLGAGIRIGHPDTGYTRHPDIWREAAGPIDADAGFDFLDGDHDASDPQDVGALLHPGHGTATSSVAVARENVFVKREPGGGSVDLKGVAPEARVVPIRVTKSVVIFGWQRRLALAIEHAIRTDCRVISISLGGLGGRRLEWALEQAEHAGVIVVAAAGNYVHFVVAPAVYPTVVACAAVGPDGRAWSGSSRGPAVDITAPGHAVWVAGWKADEPVVRLGSGTSFSAAYVAAAAALWLSAHQAELRDRPGDAPGLFRRALAATARRDPRLPPGFGAGVLDCLALLSRPVRSEFEAVGLEDPAHAAESHPALAALVGAERAAELAQSLDAVLQAELAFHLTVDSEARGEFRERDLAEGVASDVAVPLAPRWASSRLRRALRGGVSAPAPDMAERETDLRALPISTNGMASSNAGAAPAAAQVKIVIELEIRTRVEVGKL